MFHIRSLTLQFFVLLLCLSSNALGGPRQKGEVPFREIPGLGFVGPLRFSSDGGRLLDLGADGRGNHHISLLSIADGKRLRTYKGEDLGLSRLRLADFTADGHSIVLVGHTYRKQPIFDLLTVDLKTGKKETLLTLSGDATLIALWGQQHTLAAMVKDNVDPEKPYALKLINFKTNKTQTLCLVSQMRCYGFSPDRSLVMLGGYKDNRLLVLEFPTGKGRLHVQADRDISAAVISPDNRFLAVLPYRNEAVLLYDLQKEQQMETIKTSEEAKEIKALGPFSPDSRLLAFGFHKVKVVNSLTRQEEYLGAVDEHGEIRFIAFSPDGQLVACSTAANSILVWRLLPKVETKPK
jgi:WD40 repeat protein